MYSLAVVLVEAVTGRVPFAAETTVATLVGRLDTPLEAPPELGPLGPVVARAGRPDPTERLDAIAFAAALQAVAPELPAPERLALAGPATFDMNHLELARPDRPRDSPVVESPTTRWSTTGTHAGDLTTAIRRHIAEAVPSTADRRRPPRRRQPAAGDPPGSPTRGLRPSP